MVALLGPNGAGKTTLLRAISGLLPRSGRVRFAGRNMTGASPRDMVRAGLVHVVEGHRVFTHLTVFDNLLLAGYGMPRRRAGRRRLEEALAFFPEIAAKRNDRAVTLSGGQQQMLAVAQGLVRRPRLLMLDEPSAGLSPVLVDRVLAAVARLREGGTAVLLVEQLIEKALALGRSGLCARTRIDRAGGRDRRGRSAESPGARVFRAGRRRAVALLVRWHFSHKVSEASSLRPDRQVEYGRANSPVFRRRTL